MTRILIVALTLIFMGCAVKPQIDSAASVRLRSESVPEDAAYIYVINDMPIAAPYRIVSADGGDKILIPSMMFHQYILPPANHTLTVSSTVNTEKLVVDAEAGKAYYVKTGWGFGGGGGSGDTIVVPELIDESEGQSLLKKTQAVE